MKIGDLVGFPSKRDFWDIKKGLLLGFKDNPSDVNDLQNSKKYGGVESIRWKAGPRQIAEILYKGEISICWKHSLVKLTEEK